MSKILISKSIDVSGVKYRYIDIYKKCQKLIFWSWYIDIFFMQRLSLIVHKSRVLVLSLLMHV